jgi:hypothetical protein
MRAGSGCLIGERLPCRQQLALDPADVVRDVSKTPEELRRIARTPVDICVRATVLRIKRLSPEAARHHQLEKQG